MSYATGSSSVVERRSDAPEVAQSQDVSGSTPASPTAPTPTLPPQSKEPRRWGFTLGERLGRPECPYARRWIIQTPYQAIGWGKQVCGTCGGLLTDEGGRWPDSVREQAIADGWTAR